MPERDNKETPCQRAMVKDGFLIVSAVAGKRCFYGFRRCFLWFPSWQGTFLYGFRRWFFNGFRVLQDRGCVSDGNRKKTPGRFRDELRMYIYIYIYIHTYTYIYIYT